MRNRYIGNTRTGLGNPDPPILGNSLTNNEAFNSACREVFEDAIATFFAEYGGLDFEAVLDGAGFTLKMGIEPAYKHEPLLIITLTTDQGECSIQRGIARGFYGSGIQSTTKYRRECKRHGKFADFVDKWHPRLMAAMKEGAHG